MRKLRQLRSFVKISRRLSESKGEAFSPPFIAAADFKAGEHLAFYADYLYRYDPAGRLPATFIAKRDIRAGERVFNNPTDPERSDLTILMGKL